MKDEGKSRKVRKTKHIIKDPDFDPLTMPWLYGEPQRQRRREIASRPPMSPHAIDRFAGRVAQPTQAGAIYHKVDQAGSKIKRRHIEWTERDGRITPLSSSVEVPVHIICKILDTVSAIEEAFEEARPGKGKVR